VYVWVWICLSVCLSVCLSYCKSHHTTLQHSIVYWILDIGYWILQSILIMLCILYYTYTTVHSNNRYSYIFFFLTFLLLCFRKGYILINRGPLIMNDDTGEKEFDQKSCIRGRVIDRVYPGGKIFVLFSFLFFFFFNCASLLLSMLCAL